MQLKVGRSNVISILHSRLDYFKGKISFLILLLAISFLIYLFLKRVANPDIAFDSINYHFYLGKLGFDNFPHIFKGGEFFPLGTHSFNPLIDSLCYFTYTILGYRLGTVFSFLSIIGVYILIYKIGKEIIGGEMTFGAKLFLIPALAVNEAFFQVSTYFIDNVYAFLVIFYLALVLNLEFLKTRLSLWIRIFVLGIVAGLIVTKLTNFVYLIPLLLITFYFFISLITNKNCFEKKITFTDYLAFSFAYLVPLCAILLYHGIPAYIQTGNPIFPYYNGLFKSPFYPPTSWDFNFGPKNWQERIFYPYFVYKNPYLLGEVKDFFPDLKFINGILSLIGLALLLRISGLSFSRKETALLFVTIGSYLCWQLLFGYSRYAIALEFLVGLSLVIVANKIFLQNKLKLLKILTCLLLFVFIWQTKSILVFNSANDIAWRPNLSFFDWQKEFLSPNIFKKYTSVVPDVSNELQQVNVVVECVSPSSAYAATIPELMDKPMLAFDKGSNGALTFNKRYIEARDKAAVGVVKHSNDEPLTFAIVINDTNEGLRCREGCLKAIAEEKDKGRVLSIQQELKINNYVGDEKQTLTVFLGSYNPVR